MTGGCVSLHKEVVQSGIVVVEAFQPAWIFGMVGMLNLVICHECPPTHFADCFSGDVVP